MFRAAFSAAGLVLLGLAFAVLGLPAGPAFVEVALLGGGFLAGSLVWSLWKLLGPGRGG
ncbi:MAG: hypothetical protein N2422_04860 [Rhodobacteraceae bacterium]|nr:hypothetical protein [Paracoccaceae bacterium]